MCSWSDSPLPVQFAPFYGTYNINVLIEKNISMTTVWMQCPPPDTILQNQMLVHINWISYFKQLLVKILYYCYCLLICRGNKTSIPYIQTVWLDYMLTRIFNMTSIFAPVRSLQKIPFGGTITSSLGQHIQKWTKSIRQFPRNKQVAKRFLDFCSHP